MLDLRPMLASDQSVVAIRGDAQITVVGSQRIGGFATEPQGLGLVEEILGILAKLIRLLEFGSGLFVTATAQQVGGRIGERTDLLLMRFFCAGGPGTFFLLGNRLVNGDLPRPGFD